jgi:predicted dehydrogenase
MLKGKKLISRREFTKVSIAGFLGLSSPAIINSSSLSSSKLNIGQIGTAHSHADAKVETIKKLNDIYNLVGVVENDTFLKNAAKQRSAYKNITWMTEDELLNMNNLDAVLVETDLDELVPVAMRYVNAGLHVHIDKPPGKSYSDFEQLLDLAENKKLIVQMGYMFRYNPAFQFCLNSVREGLLGEIFEIDGVISKVIKSDRRSKLAATYGGGMMLLGCHLIDILIALLGEPDSLNSFRRKTYEKSDNLYDNELVVMEYKKATSTIRSALVEVEGQSRRQFVVCGTKGTIEIKPLEPPELSLALESGRGIYQKGYQQVNLRTMSGRYDEQLRDFARLVGGEKKADFTKNHDLMVHRTLLKACEIK